MNIDVLDLKESRGQLQQPVDLLARKPIYDSWFLGSGICKCCKYFFFFFRWTINVVLIIFHEQ